MRSRLAGRAPLTTPADVRGMRDAVRLVQSRQAVLLHAGDCAEPGGTAAVRSATAKHHLLGLLAEQISERTGLPVVTIGRIAGQFAKPRSQLTEVVDGQTVPAFQGVLVNGSEPDAGARRPAPGRLLTAYDTARSVMDELGRLAANGPGGGRTRQLGGVWTHGGLWTSHEALMLDYEQPLVRKDPRTGRWYLLSTHLPWIGYRTSQVDGGHVEFLAGVHNPVACKVGPGTTERDLLALCARLDPHRSPGRLTLIPRLGERAVRVLLPTLVAAVRRAGHPVVWVCDPMHGNTVRTEDGVKTRDVRSILAELHGFFDVLHGLDEWPGGVHLEIAADDVTECVDEAAPAAGLHRAYRTLCDPRLNDLQAVRVTRETAGLVDAWARSTATAAS